MRNEYRPIPQSTRPPPDDPPGSANLFSLLGRQWTVVIGTAAVVLVLAGVWLLTTRPTYETSARIRVQPLNPTLVAQARDEMRDRQQDNFLTTQAALIRATPVLAMAASMPGADEMALFNGVEDRIGLLRDLVSVEVGRREDLIDVSIRTREPRDAELVLGSLVEAYRVYQTRQRREVTAELRQKVDEERAALERRLTEQLSLLEEFHTRHPEFGVDGTRGNAAMARLADLQQALSAARVESVRARTSFEEQARLMGLDPLQAAQSPVLSDFAATEQTDQSVSAEIVRVRNDITSRSVVLGDEHPEMIRLRLRLRQLQTMMLQSRLARWRSAEAVENDLQASYDTLQAQASRHAVAQREYNRLTAELARLEETMTEVRRRLFELTISETAGALVIDVVDEPLTAMHKPSPAPARTLALALIGGLALGVALAVVRDWLDPRLSRAADVERLLGSPLLGVIPHATGRPSTQGLGWASHAQVGSALGESFRGVRSNLQLLASGCRSIAVVSPAAREGRSVLCSNLAIGLAQSGKQVLVIDADLHKPSQHQLFDLPPTPGLGEVLAGETSLDLAARETAVPRLSLLPGGAVRCADLLNGPEFTDLLAAAVRKYDVVLLDTSPAAGGTDARVVASNCDATILVVRANATNRDQAIRTRDSLWHVAANLIGVVVNDCPDISPSNLTDGSDQLGGRTRDEPAQLRTHSHRGLVDPA